MKSPAVTRTAVGTEAAIWCTQYSCELPGSGRPIPVGRPISHAEVYLLDERLEPVPLGVRGEMYVGGRGIARGRARDYIAPETWRGWTLMATSCFWGVWTIR